MKKITFLCAVLLGFLLMNGSNVLSPASRIYMQQLKSGKLHKVASQCTTQTIIVVDGDEGLKALKVAGINVESAVGDAVIATVSDRQLQSIGEMPHIKYVDRAHRIHLLTDAARNLTHVEQVLNGTGLSSAYTGKGVVVGIVDCGFDFSHLAFRASDGTTRIKAVYLPDDMNGNSPVIDGNTLPGSEYTAPEDILALTTDNGRQSHGSHTAGIAVGSTVGNYGGMAPEADIVLCGMSDSSLTDANVINSTMYVANYAKSKGKACVISLSLGNHDGPHDGTGLSARAFDEISKQSNAIVVLAAGNEGNNHIYMNKKFTDGDLLLSSCVDAMSSNGDVQVEVDAWSRNDAPIAVQFHVVDRSRHKVLCSTDFVATDTVLNFADVDALKDYATGTIAVGTAKSTINNRMELLFDTDINLLSSSYILGFSYKGMPGQEIDVWETSGQNNFVSSSVKGFVDGSNECSISDMATGERTVSAGAYVSRQSYENAYGSTVSVTRLPIGSIAPFSSYGKALNGKLYPLVTAPGVGVISALNSYGPYSGSPAMTANNLEGRKNSWGAKNGTSMATPCVAGIIALWLQANPKLDIEAVKEIIRTTSMKDAFVTSGGIEWGAGKIDAYAGLQKALTSGIDENASDSREVSVFYDRESDCVHVAGTALAGSVVSVYNVYGQLMSRVGLSGESNAFRVNMLDYPAGLYFVKLDTQQYSKTAKLFK